MKTNTFNAGFRLSLLDVLVLLVGGISAWYCKDTAREMSYIIFFIVAHFFYFCNLVRMSRIPELMWATSFIVLFIINSYVLFIPQYLVYFSSLVITFVLTWFEIQKPSYHGVFWQRINPELPAWFEDNRSRT